MQVYRIEDGKLATDRSDGSESRHSGCMLLMPNGTLVENMPGIHGCPWPFVLSLLKRSSFCFITEAGHRTETGLP